MTAPAFSALSAYHGKCFLVDTLVWMYAGYTENSSIIGNVCRFMVAAASKIST